MCCLNFIFQDELQTLKTRKQYTIYYLPVICYKFTFQTSTFLNKSHLN
jgi:hypothetical protein